MEERSTDRRTFFRWILGLFGSLPVVGPWLGCLPRGSRFSSGEQVTLGAMCERLVPSEDGAGAREAGVAEYVNRALSTRFCAPWYPGIREGLRRLDRLSLDRWKSPFANLNVDWKDQAIRFLQAGGCDEDSFRGESFVHRLLELTLEGFLGDPVHGGNRGETGWQYIGTKPGGPRPGSCGKHD